VEFVLPLFAAERLIPLDSTSGMQPIGVDLAIAVYKGRKAVRVKYREGEDGRSLALLPGIDFGDGVIDYDFAGDVKPGSPPEYRGFTGLAFRVSADSAHYECFYQRPLNARSENQEQRNHSVQYISLPDYPWEKLRKEVPGKYETYAEMAPGEWTHVKIEVRGETARVYIGRATQPTMIVHDLKNGPLRGTLALWVGIGTVAHFANLRITQ
jgi:hypothetical protein